MAVARRQPDVRKQTHWLCSSSTYLLQICGDNISCVLCSKMFTSLTKNMERC